MTAMAAEASVVQRRPFQEVWVISLGHALTHWYPATFYLLLPLIGKELGLSYGEIGSILTCQFAAGAIANVPGGIFVDTVGRKGLLMAFALCWVGIPYLVMGFSHAYWMMLACATLVGIGNNIWHPTAIPWLADRFSERKGLVMAFHSMGGNIGDAVAPLVIGFLLQSYNWRTVVLMNVVPGIVVACFILVYVGRLQMAEVRAGLAKFKPAALSGAQRVRMLLALLSNKALVTLAIGSAFRSMNSRRVVDLPAALSGARYGIFSALDWRMHVCPAGCGLRGGPDRGTFIRYGWASADHHVEHVDDRHRDSVHDLCRRHRLVRVACGAPGILSLRGTSRAAGMAIGRHTGRHGRQRHWNAVWRTGNRTGIWTGQRRHRGRSFRSHVRILFPRRHNHPRQFDDLHHSGWAR